MAASCRILGLALLCLTQSAQFRSGVDLVRFDVFVLDKARHPIGGLTAEDFRVTEDGRPLRIAGFQAVTIPGPAPAPAAAAAKTDPRVETVTNRSDGPGRLVVIVMDRSIPNESPIVTARRIADATVDALGPNDFGAVVFTSGITGYRAQGFTRDRGRLKAAIASAQMGTPADVGMTGGGLRRAGPGASGGACYCGLCSLEKLTTIVEALESGRDYRKMIVFIGDDLPLSDSSAVAGPAECRGRFRNMYERMLHAIDRSNVTIHAFSPRGLDTGQLGADAFRGDTRESALARMEREGSLAALPEYSGGRAVMNANEPERFVPAVFEESRTYYALAVERGPARQDGRAHSVKIAVTRPDAIVASRAAYFDASAGDRAQPSSDTLEQAVTDLLPRTEVPLGMTLAPGSSKGSSLDVTLATPRPTAARADVLVAVFDEFAKQVGSERARVELPARDGADVEWKMHLNPKPGRYEVRAAVRIGDRTGSVAGFVEVTEDRRARDEPARAPAASPVRSAALEAMLATAGAYLEQYADPGTGLLLEEAYEQQVRTTRRLKRVLKSDLLILHDATEGWVEFRDVLAVDGKAIADRSDRLLQIFSAVGNDPRAQARRLTEEGARYNISGRVKVTRTLNHPMVALLYLRSANQPRSIFRMEGDPGADGQRVSFAETRKPAMIATPGGEPAKGDLWIDGATGRIRRAELRLVSRAPGSFVAATFRVRYADDAKTGLMLPVTMDEHYDIRDARGTEIETIDGSATYSNPRQFRVAVGGG